jgi:hypothetical protein
MVQGYKPAPLLGMVAAARMLALSHAPGDPARLVASHGPDRGATLDAEAGDGDFAAPRTEGRSC